MLISRLLDQLFNTDQAFVEIARNGFNPRTREVLQGFWRVPELAEVAAFAASDFDADSLAATLESLASPVTDYHTFPRDPQTWRLVAERSEELARTDPVAAVVAALHAIAAWEGALGPSLYSQPFLGPHWGWEIFPLVLARNLLAAEAPWTAGSLALQAADLLAAAHEPSLLQSILDEYRNVWRKFERRREDAVDNLAYDLLSASGDQNGFRAELAALFWTLGDVVHARLLSPDGSPSYRPPLGVVRDLVAQCVRMHTDLLPQHVWLEMKDRPPFDLRAHRMIFGLLNRRYWTPPVVDMIEGTMGVSPPRAYARAIIGFFRGRLNDSDFAAIGRILSMHRDVLRKEAPAMYFHIVAVAELMSPILPTLATMSPVDWPSLAQVATSMAEWAGRQASLAPYDRWLDIPFLCLPATTNLEWTLDTIEGFRAANLWYWLTVVPPAIAAVTPEMEALVGQERTVLQELRGARFIGRLDLIPEHYRRFVRDLEAELEDRKNNNNPFDPSVASREFEEACGRLNDLHKQMQAFNPGYAACRADPKASLEQFVAALRA